MEFYLWVGMFAPKGTPAPIITTLRDASKKAAADDKFKQAMTNLGQDVAYLDQAGVHLDFVKLADIGIRGNGHLMMLEMNSEQIAQVVADWLLNVMAKTEAAQR